MIEAERRMLGTVRAEIVSFSTYTSKLSRWKENLLGEHFFAWISVNNSNVIGSFRLQSTSSKEMFFRLEV